MMNRRSFLGVMGIGAAAGPSVIKECAADLIPHSPATIPTVGYQHKSDYVTSWNPVEELTNIRKEYSNLTKDPAAWIADYFNREYRSYIDYTSYRYEMIDSDIRNLKSLSESAKMRMYLERKAKREYQRYSESLIGRIQDLMKEVK